MFKVLIIDCCLYCLRLCRTRFGYDSIGEGPVFCFFRSCNPLIFSTYFGRFQKGVLLGFKRGTFALQNESFWSVKGVLLECKTSPFENGGLCTGVVRAVLGPYKAVFRFFQLYKQLIKVLPNPETIFF